MRCIFALLAFVNLFALLVARPSPRSESEGWTWVLASSLEEPQNVELASFARKMFDFYQRNSTWVGELVPESALEKAPGKSTVFLGPADGFQHPEWLAPLVAIDGEQVAVAGRVLEDPATGIFVRSRDGSRIVLSGTSSEGFRQIFGVRTGMDAATITVRGRVALLGDYRSGSLKFRSDRFLPLLPAKEALRAEVGDARDAVDLSPVYEADGARALTAPFQRRLGALVKEPRVLFVGESHWNVGINRLFQHMLGWLMEQRSVSTLFLEQCFSHSAHYDHYVTIASDDEAERFWSDFLRPLVTSQLTRELLDSVRVWNREHAESRVVVACVDAEFQPWKILEGALATYFRALDPTFELQLPANLTGAAALREVARMSQILERQTSAESPLPWMSKRFVSRALTNLEESILSEGKATRMAERQGIILRNITEFHRARFAAAELDRGLAVFKMGGAHADRTALRDDGYWWEAPYLDRKFEPTRSRVATLLIDAIGVSFDGVAEVGPKTHKLWAKNYNDYVADYRSALRSGAASPGQVFLFGRDELSGLEKSRAGSKLRNGRQGAAAQCRLRGRPACVGPARLQPALDAFR